MEINSERFRSGQKRATGLAGGVSARPDNDVRHAGQQTRLHLEVNQGKDKRIADIIKRLRL